MFGNVTKSIQVVTPSDTFQRMLLFARGLVDVRLQSRRLLSPLPLSALPVPRDNLLLYVCLVKESLQDRLFKHVTNRKCALVYMTLSAWRPGLPGHNSSDWQLKPKSVCIQLPV